MSDVSRQNDATNGQPSAWLKRREAAEYLGYKEATLRAWASQGRGPRYKKYGTGRGSRVRYAREEVVRFAEDPAGYASVKGIAGSPVEGDCE